MNIQEALLMGIPADVTRTTFPPEVLQKIIAPTSGSAKHVLANNLCYGETPQIEMGKKAKLDPGSLSRSIARWVEAGVVIRVGPDQFPLHVYRLAKPDAKSAMKAD